jgi:hypothetical protein
MRRHDAAALDVREHANEPAEGRQRRWSRGSRAGGELLLALVCVSTTLLLLNTEVLPLGAVRAEDLASDYGLLTWNFWEVTESVLHGKSPYHTDLLFHPLGSNLAAHTLGPGFVPLGLAAKAARHGARDYPLSAHRAAILACFAAGMLLAFHALRGLGADTLPAVAAAVGWAFAAIWRLLVANPTLAAACFLVPGATLLATRLVQAPSRRRAVALAAWLGAAVYFSEYFSAFLALAVVVAVAAALPRRTTREALRGCLVVLRPRGLALAATAALVVALPFLLSWSRSEGRPPRARQMVVGGANLAGFVVPDPAVTPLYSGARVAALQARITRGRGPFLGLPTLLLAAVGAAVAPRRLRLVFLAVAVVFLLLSLGPRLKVFGTNTGVPLPYAALQQIPPFHMARDPQRLAVLGVWVLVSLAALGLTALGRRLSRGFHPWGGGALALLAFAWWAAEGYKPGLQPVFFSPPAPILRLPDGAVANLPLQLGDGLAMLLQVFHGRPIVTGYVSRTSERQFEHVSRLQGLLESDPRAFALALRAIGVATLVLEPGTPDEVAEALAGFGFTVVDLRAGPRLLPAGAAGRHSK